MLPIQPRLRRRSDRVVAATASSSAATTPAAAEGSAPSSPAPSSTKDGGEGDGIEDEKALKKSLIVLWNDIDGHRFSHKFHRSPANSEDVLK